MAFCPNCKYEYRPEVNVCPDCEEPLVSSLASAAGAAAQPPNDDWVSVCALPDDLKSEMAKGALDSNNIPSVVMSGAFKAFGPGFSPGGVLGQGGSREATVLMVPREYRDEATVILQAILGDDFTGLDAR